VSLLPLKSEPTEAQNVHKMLLKELNNPVF